MLYIGDTHATIYFCVYSVIYAYILEVHMIIAFNVFSHFLDRKIIWNGLRKSYEGLNWSGFSVPWD